MEQQIIIQQEEWYQLLVEQCRAIIVETRFKSAIDLLEGKWRLGKEVWENKMNFERAGYGEKMVETLAKDIGISASHLYKCIEFYKKFPAEDFEQVIPKLPAEEGKAISWYKLCQKYLPETKEEIEIKQMKEQEKLERQQLCPHTILVCKICKKEFTTDELIQWIEQMKQKSL
jgi:hypothetical protein